MKLKLLKLVRYLTEFGKLFSYMGAGAVVASGKPYSFIMSAILGLTGAWLFEPAIEVLNKEIREELNER